MLDQLDPKIANSLFLRCALLGPSGTALARLSTREPAAAEAFRSSVSRIAATAPDWSDRSAFLHDAVEGVCSELHRFKEGTRDFRDWCFATAKNVAAYEIDPIAEANRAAVVATARLYTDLGLTDAILHSEVPTELQYVNEPLQVFGLPSAITAKIVIRPDRRLIVKIHPGTFDQDAVCAMPYVLFHEHVCHTARVALGGPPPQETMSL